MTTESERIVSLHGCLSIYEAREIKARLTKALATGKPIVVQGNNITKIDLPVLQLFTATQKEALQTKQTIHFNLALSDSLSLSIRRAGFSHLLQLSTS
jgi:anti-anti-sigma regulatory factor